MAVPFSYPAPLTNLFIILISLNKIRSPFDEFVYYFIFVSWKRNEFFQILFKHLLKYSV